MDRLRRTVVADRAVAAQAGSEAGRGQTEGPGPPGVVRDPVRAAYRHPVGAPAAGAGLWLGDDVLAAPGRLERGRRLGRTALGAAEEAAGGEEARLVAGGDRFLSRPGGSQGPKSGPSPVDCARPGSKHHVLTDGQGIPLAVSLTGGNRNDVTQLLPSLDKVPTVAGVVGRPRRRPDALLADRGYDHDKYRRLVRECGITPVIAERGQEHGAHHRLAARLPPPADPLRTTRRHPRGLPRPRHLPNHPPPRPTPLLGPLREHLISVHADASEMPVSIRHVGTDSPVSSRDILLAIAQWIIVRDLCGRAS